MIRILLADDHAVLRESLGALLRASGECTVVAEANNGVAAVELAMATHPDVAIVDISMPLLSGIEVVQRIHAQLPGTRILVLTMHEDEEYVLHMVRAGANGYLLKHAAAAEVLGAVRTLAAGGVHFGEFATKLLATQLRQPNAQVHDPYGSLSPREREIFHLVVDGCTTKEIAKRLGITVKTAENHRCRLLDKLDVRNSAELVRYAVRKRLVE
jgi:DNA-binding NarL/FixJ family response regulator